MTLHPPSLTLLVLSLMREEELVGYHNNNISGMSSALGLTST